MKYQFVLIFTSLLFLNTVLFAQTETKNINGTDFVFKKTDLDCFHNNCSKVTLYRNKTEILSHILFFEDGDTMCASVEIGKYFIKKNQIIFYSYYGNHDRLISFVLPYGFRKQVYEVDLKGKIKIIESQIYLETSLYKTEKNKMYYSSNDYVHLGLNFLKNKPKNAFEINALNDYKNNIEIEYHAKFVVGNERKQLEKEVRNALKNEINSATQDWIENEYFGTIKK